MIEDPKIVRQRFAHALLSPLTVVLGSLDVLLNQSAAWPDPVKEVLQLAMAQTHRLHDTLNDLLATVEVDGNTVHMTWSAVPAPHRQTQPPEPGAQQPSEKGNA
jgi:signal transduction histidine kinase